MSAHYRAKRPDGARPDCYWSWFLFSLLQPPTAVVGASQLISVHLSECNWSIHYYYFEVKRNEELINFMNWNLCFSLALLDPAAACIDPTQTIFQFVVYNTNLFYILYFLSKAAVCSPTSNELGIHLFLIEVDNKTLLWMRGQGKMQLQPFPMWNSIFPPCSVLRTHSPLQQIQISSTASSTKRTPKSSGNKKKWRQLIVHTWKSFIFSS